jgi:hypothetical protein
MSVRENVFGMTVILMLVAFVGVSAGDEPSSSAPRRIVAVGDVHGDLPQLMAVLQMCEVTDRAGRWIANSTTTVVQVGDLLDRGPHDKEVMDFFINLKTDAMRNGARVVNLLGNHELMNLASQFHYVHPESNEAFGGRHKRRKAFATDGLYGQLLSNFPLVHIEGRTLFVHAGLLPDYAKKGVSALNDQAHRALLRGDFNNAIFGTDGPIWTRLMITDAVNDRCADVEETLRILDVDRMVVGHTPQRTGRLGAFCGDKLLAVDVGMSKWMYGKLAALEITLIDAEGRNVELREVLPQKITGSSLDSHEDDDDKDADGNPESVGNDPMLLQEMLDALHEYEGRQKKQRHDEL